jgi:hypothetical protein
MVLRVFGHLTASQDAPANSGASLADYENIDEVRPVSRAKVRQASVGAIWLVSARRGAKLRIGTGQGATRYCSDFGRFGFQFQGQLGTG